MYYLLKLWKLLKMRIYKRHIWRNRSSRKLDCRISKKHLTRNAELSFTKNWQIIFFGKGQWRIQGAPPVCAPLRTKIFLISCSFWENPANLYVGAPPPRDWRPLLRGILYPPLKALQVIPCSPFFLLTVKKPSRSMLCFCSFSTLCQNVATRCIGLGT